jgi:outer membrane protein OmpA-like peptidoglycan-associated protein
MISALLLAGCAGTPDTNPAVKQAQNSYKQIKNDTLVANNAPIALKEARKAVMAAQSTLKNGKDKAVVDHKAYMATQKIKIAKQTAMLNAAQDEVKRAKTERQKVQLKARKSEAEAAERRAKQQQAKAEEAQRSAKEAQQKAQKLADQLKNLKAKMTKRGLVLTLGDVLFDVDKADLKPGGEKAASKLAHFLKEYPKRQVLIEGYTDNTGSEDYNLKLSKHRAKSVKQAIVNDGIASNRINTIGYGEQYPVATNNTSAGRQRNRRVEVVISKKNKQVQPRQRQDTSG